MKLSAKAVLLASAFSADSDIRYYLNGVHVAPHPNGGAAITGCDGHRVIQVHDKDAKDVEEVIISLDKTALAKLKRAAFVVPEYEPKRLALTDKDGIPLYLQPLAYKVEAKYVDLAKVLGERTDWEAGLRGTFNVSYIAEAAITIADAIGEGKYGRYQGVEFYAWSKTNPEVPHDTGKTLFIVGGAMPAWGIVMGMRGDYVDPLTVPFGKAA